MRARDVEIPACRDTVRGRLVVFSALSFSHETPEGLLDHAWRNVGRASEVRHHFPGTALVTLASGPKTNRTLPAYERAVEVMNEGGLNVVRPLEADIVHALGELGLLGPDRDLAEA